MPRDFSGGAGDGERPSYTRYRASRSPLRRASDDDELGLERLAPRRDRAPAGEWWRRVTLRRLLVGLLVVLVGWVGLSVALFLISAQLEQVKPTGEVSAALDHGGFPLTSASTILVLGSDQRTKATHEPGASTSGPSRSDTMLLVRTGGGAAARLSIPRDTVVDIPGHGVQKINAAYAFGGAALAIRTVKQLLGIPINHIVEVNFDNFPQLIDAMGGVDFTTSGCIVSKINGGFANGGYTLRLKKGTHRLSGRQALALARTRHNSCHAHESDLTRATRQQQLFTAMRGRLTSLSGFLRMPFISWNAPKAIRSDMGGPTLMGLFGGLAIAGSPAPRLLRPTGSVQLPDGSIGLGVSDGEKRAEAARLMRG